jgi:DNA-binding MarR family transcriptional regulator
MARARTPIDSYVLDTLMRDLTGHDRSPASFIVYLYLWHRARGSERIRVSASLRELADETGLSRRGVQDALRRLHRRGLISSVCAHATAIPDYRIHRPWIRRKARS